MSKSKKQNSFHLIFKRIFEYVVMTIEKLATAMGWAGRCLKKGKQRWTPVKFFQRQNSVPNELWRQKVSSISSYTDIRDYFELWHNSGCSGPGNPFHQL